MGWRDFDIAMEKQADGDIKVMIDEDAIRNSLINIFSTMKGSRRMIPEAFIDLHRILFEPMDTSTAQQIGESLVNAIRLWDDRVIILNFNVDINEDSNSYATRITYQMANSTNIATLDYVFRSA